MKPAQLCTITILPIFLLDFICHWPVMEQEMKPSDHSEIPDWSPCTTSTPIKENTGNVSSSSIVAWTPNDTHESPKSTEVPSSILSQWSIHDDPDASLSVVEWTPDGRDMESSVADSVVPWNESHTEQCITPLKASDSIRTPSTANLVAMKPKQISFLNADTNSQLSSEGEGESHNSYYLS